MLTLVDAAQVLMRSALCHSQSNPYAEEFEERRLRCLDAHKREETSRSMRRSSTGGLGVGTPRSGFCPHQQNPQPTSIHRLPLRLVQKSTLTGVALGDKRSWKIIAQNQQLRIRDNLSL
jgi:hypothetical protein